MYHDAWVDERYATVSILHTPWHMQPYTTTNALAVANGPPTVWEKLAN